MYMFTIRNDIKEQNDLFIYDDKDVHLPALLQSFTEDTLNAMVFMCLGEYLPLTDETFRKCSSVIEVKFPNETYIYSTIYELFKRVQEAPESVVDELEELAIASRKDDFEADGEEFVNNGCAGFFGSLEFMFDWTIWNDNTYNYMLVFNFGNDTCIAIALEHKNGFDQPPLKSDWLRNRNNN